MDWRSINFDWNRARAFLVTAEEGSFSAAAKALGTTQPTIGRQVDALEAELGVTLFDRSGRGISVTPTGQSLMRHVRAMADAASHLSLSASGQSQAISGTVSISASEIYTLAYIPPIVAKLRQLYPALNIEIVPSNNAVDLSRREADIAIRNFRPVQSDLIARKIGDDQGYLFATPDYLASIGNPTSVSQLTKAQFIGMNAATTEELKGMSKYLGFHLSDAQLMIIAGNHYVHWELARQGLGIGIVPINVGDQDPLVVRAVNDLPLLDFPVWLTTHREVKTAGRIRAVFDVMAETLPGLMATK